MTSYLNLYTEDMKRAFEIPSILKDYDQYYDGSGGDDEYTFEEFFYYGMSPEDIENMINLVKRSGIEFEFDYHFGDEDQEDN